MKSFHVLSYIPLVNLKISCYFLKLLLN
ncbi:unnamed protein product [Spirodela intermedia]|uniref:Uncharacterized protein n=2 Tax=Spirodela intermedia TaxID=51605 RepID=A0A7I8IBX8_SPIIN|nr:unnamed protein product [Spirodela intermedia]CAA6655080.1 unnamed protein product [Spirodela intermedia]CAA7389830.1 unnamed protein product [Spirodela intermedia]